jgi:hypothetical protein
MTMPRLVWPVLLVLVLGAGFYLGRAGFTPVKTGDSTVPGKEAGAGGSSIPGKSGLPSREMTPPAGPSLGNTEPLSKRPPQQDKAARSDDDHAWREDLAASMRQQGVPEGEIQTHLDGLNALSGPPSAEEIYSPYELTPGEMSDDELKEQIRSSLQDSGFSPEEIERHVEAAFQMMRQGQQKQAK